MKKQDTAPVEQRFEDGTEAQPTALQVEIDCVNPPSEEQLALGYPVAEGCTTYGDAFTAGAMALENVGDISDVVTTDYGYFIFRYADDLTAGSADFEARREAETA